jgi:hypothetical protein
MPKAPLYNGPQVTPGQFSGGMLSTHVADMSPIGAGLTSLGENLFRIRREEQQRAQDMQLTQALGKAREAQTTELYDPQDGLMLKEGGDLFSSVADRLDRFKQKLSSIRDSLSSDDARLTFDRASDSLFQEVNRSAQIRVGTQREKTNEQTARGFIDSDVDAVANGLTYTAPATVPSNPDGSFNFQAIDDTLYRMTLSVRDKVVNKAGGHAVPDEQVIKEESIKEQGQAALKWLDIMLANGDTKMADAFMKRYGHIIPTDKKGTAIRAVESGTVASEAQGHADGIIDYVSTGTKLTLTQQEAKANEQIAARFKDDVKMRDEVQRRVTVEFNRRQALEKGAVEDTFKDYYERLNKGEKLGKMEVELAFHTMDPRHQDLIRKMSEEKEAGKDLGKDEAKIYKYMQVAYSNDPKVREQFRTMDLTTTCSRPTSASRARPSTTRSETFTRSRRMPHAWPGLPTRARRSTSSRRSSKSRLPRFSSAPARSLYPVRCRRWRTSCCSRRPRACSPGTSTCSSSHPKRLPTLQERLRGTKSPTPTRIVFGRSGKSRRARLPRRRRSNGNTSMKFACASKAAAFHFRSNG